MDTILIFVVLPLATIIFSIALQRLLKCPILVAAIVFAVFLILTYTVLGTDFIIAAIVYSILAFITAFLVCLICRILTRLRGLEDRGSDDNCNSENSCGCNCSREGRRNGRNNNCECNGNNSEDDNLLTISSRCGNGENTKPLTISTGGINGNNNSSNCGCNNNCNCGCNNDNNNERIVLNAEVVPANNGNAGIFRGNFRRRRWC